MIARADTHPEDNSPETRCVQRHRVQGCPMICRATREKQVERHVAEGIALDVSVAERFRAEGLPQGEFEDEGVALLLVALELVALELVALELVAAEKFAAGEFGSGEFEDEGLPLELVALGPIPLELNVFETVAAEQIAAGDLTSGQFDDKIEVAFELVAAEKDAAAEEAAV